MGSRVLAALVVPSTPRTTTLQDPLPRLAAMHSWTGAARMHPCLQSTLPRPRRGVACNTSGAGASSAFEGGWYADENRVYHPMRALSFWTKQEPPKEEDRGQTAGDPGQGTEHAKPPEYPQPLHVQRELYTVNVGTLQRVCIKSTTTCCLQPLAPTRSSSWPSWACTWHPEAVPSLRKPSIPLPTLATRY